MKNMPDNDSANGGNAITSKNASRREFEDPTEIDLRRILVVTDFSEKSRRTYPSAVRLAKRFGAPIQLVHFSRKRAPEYSGITDKQHLKSLYQSLAAESKEDKFAGVEVKTSLLELRDIGRSLSEFQQEKPYDLIVAHTLSHKGYQRHFDSQIAEKIVAKSSVPVLLFGPAALDSGIEKPKSVMVPFDFSDKAMATFPAIRFLAKHYQCSTKFLCVQVFRIHWIQRIFGANQNKIETFSKQFEELMANELSTADVELEICQGLPEIEFCNRATDASADLIVIGTYGTLGSLSKCVIRQAQCPVMTVPTNRKSETTYR